MNMRLLAGIALAVSMAAADAPMMGNYAVWEMHKKGVPTEQIIASIRGSEPRFNLDPAEVSKLTSNGVPQAVIDAMTARQLAPKGYVASRPQSVPRERPSHWGMVLGTPEATIGGGLATTFPHVGSPDGATVFEGAVGINRYLAALASFNRFGTGVNVQGFNIGRHTTESLFGVRVSASNSSRFTPFVTGLFGVGHQSIGPLSKNTPAAGVGVGFEANVTRNVGFRFEPRVTYGVDYDFWLHANFGVFFRFGR